MPTYNRRPFVARAIAYFLRQDYPNKELVVVDDGDDDVSDLVPAAPHVRYVRLPRRLSLGAKRNECVRQARGDLIMHWDDDDWMAPHRISAQVEALLRDGAEVCGLRRMLFHEPATGRAWLYEYSGTGPFWAIGGSLLYTRDYWRRGPFPDLQVGEDTRFLWSRAARAVILTDLTCYVALVHAGNTSPKRTDDSYWHPHPAEEVRRLLGEDWAFYAQAPAPAVPTPASPERNVPMMTAAKAGDLALPEYVAFNLGQSLPWMRRWELPFALFQARLSDTASVLDCTINPCNFHERLTRLYPHTYYQHWSPIRQGRFALPFGVPDGAFDRVICVNTLEHLLRPQRAALVADMARKLKPGGLLVLTSDYYFDSSWDKAAFLKTGVMRADRTEVFNGWNKVTPGEWLELCRANDLHPLAEPCEEPREDAPDLYRNPPPHDHACVGGVFSRSPRAELPPGKKVVLALLTWNTRDVSLDSVRAYLREAALLRRLGQSPVLCVCDNGSTDGTAEALRALEGAIDVPYRFLFNSRNLGNSVARNQIIDCALEAGADYLLFMDGDIEIVPFSGFAMLRHMENCGSRLGCIGADSGGQTPDRGRASPALYGLDGARADTTNVVAWTQYGMFRRALFEEGVRFDESGPFNGAGWGFEDNDLAFQMETKGYLNQRFFGMTYLHRAMRSSVRIMREHNIDAQGLYVRRRQYLLDKWARVPGINDGPLAVVRRFSTHL